MTAEDHMDDGIDGMRAALGHRFGEAVPELQPGQGPESCPQTWAVLARRGSCRRFSGRPVAPALVETLCALALCAPTKSDLQQRDIVIVEGPARARIDALLSTGLLAQDWIPAAPVLLVFCGNNRRQRQLHAWRGKPFANDHLDAFFNAAVDAGIALSAFVLAAEAAGLGCACISAIRNHAPEVSDLLGLPDHTFPVAGLGLGWPARDTHISLRLPLSATVHRGRFSEDGIRERIDAYDRRRAAVQPIRAQRATARFGTAQFYGWSEDKVRQYASPERADWGGFVRAKGFKLE
jgi:nitroreductase/FMN reductase [NAD(P)H]